jgi:protein-glutamine gamma-glutamyltransferase
MIKTGLSFLPAALTRGFQASTVVDIETTVKVITYLVSLIGYAAVANHVDILFSVAFLSLFAFSLYFEYSKRFFIPRWALNILSLTVIALSFYRFDITELVIQIIDALLMLLAIKLIEKKQFRDYMQIYAIVLFLLAGLGLLSLGIAFSMYLFIVVILLTVSMVLLTYYSQDPGLKLSKQTVLRIVIKSMYIPLLAIPLTAVMFVVLPRTQYPILGFLDRADKAKTGFADNVRLGGVSGIQEDSSAILRVNMERIDEESLYWRGVVLDRFDGTSWKSAYKRVAPMAGTAPVKGRKVNQTVYLEPYENFYLFALDKPVFISLGRTRKYTDLTYTSFASVEKRIRYDAISTVSDTIVEDLVDEKPFLQIPEGISPKVSDLVLGLTSGKNREESIRSILRFLNDGTYRYSMDNLPITKTPLEDFLFKVKYGNCEYFASSFAVMLRIAGIPSRLVGGYKGGHYNEMGRYYLVPQKNAHVWVEVFIKGRGWVRMDPTPGGMEPFSSAAADNIMFRMSLFLDTINYYWYAFVINYNFEKQWTILQTIRTAFRGPHKKFSLDTKNAAKTGAILLIIVATTSAIFYGVAKGFRRRPEEMRLLDKFLSRLDKSGCKKLKSQGLEEFARTIADKKMRENSLVFVEEFEKLYFKDKSFTGEDVRRLSAILRTIKHP